MSERLEEIEKTLEHPNVTEHNGQEEIFYMVSESDFKWLIQQVEHWKKCTESEQKIAGKLQKKVEKLEKLSKNLNHELFSARTERDKLREEVKALKKLVDFLEVQRERMGDSHQQTIKDAGQLLQENQRYKQALVDEYGEYPKILSENERYKQALEEILEKDSRVAKLIARQALEDDTP